MKELSPDYPIFHFTPDDPWTINDAYEGLQVFGATGSGKTSAPLKKVRDTFLKEGFGGVVLCAKKEEASDWKRFSQETGREDDFIYLSQECFDFITYEAERNDFGGGQTENIVNILMQVAELDQKGKKQDVDFWVKASKRLLRNTIDLLKMVNEKISLRNMYQVIAEAPTSKEDVNKSNKVIQFLELAAKNEKKKTKEDPDYNSDYFFVKNYWFSEYPKLGKTRPGIVETYLSIADGLMRGELGRCFSNGKMTFSIDDTYLKGKVIVVDYSVKEWNELGRYANVIIKYLFQKCIERRSNKERPTFLYADESHYFTTSYDQLFQTTARASRCISVYATQNIPNYHIEIGKEKTDSLMGNMQTKVFCQNGDPVTNKWAAECIDKELVERRSGGYSTNASHSGHERYGSAQNENWSEQKDFSVEPKDFSSLPKGGEKNFCKVGYIVWQSGRVFSTENNYIKSTFSQECRGGCGKKAGSYACGDQLPDILKEEDKSFFYKGDYIKLALSIISICLIGYGYYIIKYDDNSVNLFQKLFFGGKLKVSIKLSFALITLSGLLMPALWKFLLSLLEVIICIMRKKTFRIKKETLNVPQRKEFLIMYLVFLSLFSYVLMQSIELNKSNLKQIFVVWVVVTMFGALIFSSPKKKIRKT